MAVREVLRYPHPALKQVATPLERGDREMVPGLTRDLLDTMRAHERCVGLAATQIGVMARAVVVDVSEHPKAKKHHGLLLLLNPRIAFASGSKVGREGCLSIPELTANVRRATAVVLEASTPEGEHRVIEAEGFEALCLQHELDHLDGVLFLDRVDSVDNVFRRQG